MSKKLWSIIDRLLVNAGIVAIWGYKLFIAPLWIGGCRHYPTCSEYAIEALRRFGFRQGGRAALGRIWRCRPGGTFGYDPMEHSK